MNKGDKAKNDRKQAEESILNNMRDILERVPFENKQDATDQEEKIDKAHVFSVINHFTALKRSVKF